MVNGQNGIRQNSSGENGTDKMIWINQWTVVRGLVPSHGGLVTWPRIDTRNFNFVSYNNGIWYSFYINFKKYI